jgi:geranylgeranyl diphosphate synthase type I
MPAPDAWLDAVRRHVDAQLDEFFSASRVEMLGLAPEAMPIVEAVEALTLRGGKRLRPAVLVAAFTSVSASGDWRATADACAALELLQTYLLIHDDWMDGDEQRRGGPSVHAALRDRVGDAHLGASLAVLAGDLASAFSQRLMVRASSAAKSPVHALEAFVRMQTEVVCGQSLDLLATTDVPRMQQLKTGSYTVAGPLRLGALLAGATPEQLEVLEAFGAPMGEAFQLRDDLLGTFGDPRTTGKPSGNDLRAGKRTALVLEAEQRLDADARAPLTRVLGFKEATDAQVAEASALLVESGAKAGVEGRLDMLVQQAVGALDTPLLHETGRAMLQTLVEALAVRDR